MNRRTFFNKIGAAILGTAIALKIPDQLIPQTTATNLEDDCYASYLLIARFEFTVKMPRHVGIIYGVNC